MRLATICLALLLTACSVQAEDAYAPPQNISIENPIEQAQSDTSLEWDELSEGLESQTFVPENRLLAEFTAVRIDPTAYSFRIHYSPNAPMSIQEWRDVLPDAEVIVNSNFFSPNHEVVGMLITDGVLYGQPYTSRGGMFSIQDDIPSVRSNIYEPYIVGEPISQAVQTFPMLVYDNQQAYWDNRGNRPTRRSVIGIDNDGQVVIMATPLLGLSLFDLSEYLSNEPQLNLQDALNLDGGGSTALYIKATDYTLSGFDPIPAVIAVYRND